MPHVRVLARAVAALGVAGLVAGCECQPADPVGADGTVRVPPTPSGKPPAPRPDGLYASPHRLGPLSGTLAPTVAAIDEKLPEKYTVRAAGPNALKGATVEVLVGEEVVLEILPSADGTHIGQAVARGGHVVFPWNTKVGMRAADQKNWSRMTCAAAPTPFEGYALCNAFAEGRIGYLLKGWEGDPAVVPPREAMDDLTIAGMVWTPDASGPDAKPKPEGTKAGAKAPKVIELVPVEE